MSVGEHSTKMAAPIQALLQGVGPIGEANSNRSMLVQGTAIFMAEIQVLVEAGRPHGIGTRRTVVRMELVHTDLRPKGNGSVNITKAGIAGREHHVLFGTLDLIRWLPRKLFAFNSVFIIRIRNLLC